MVFFPFYASDFLGATAFLSLTERSIYSLMLVFYYERSPFPLDKRRLYAALGCTTAEQTGAVDAVLDEYFVLAPDGYHNPRADREIAADAERRESFRARANKRWNRTSGNPAVSQRDEPEPSQSDDEPGAEHMQEPSSDDAIALLEHCYSSSAAMQPKPKPKPKPIPKPKPGGKAGAEPEIFDSETASLSRPAKPFAQADQAESQAPPKKRLPKPSPISYDAGLRVLVGITDAMREGWREAYPAIDVNPHLRRIEVWLGANPQKRPRNYERFLNLWLAKEQDKAAIQAAPMGRHGQGMGSKQTALERRNAEAVEEWLRGRPEGESNAG